LDLWVIPNKGDGSGTFDLTRYTKPVANSVLTAIVVGDFNADGKQDLTLLTQGNWNPLTESTDANTAGALLLPGNGDYTFGTPTLVATNTYPISGAYADFNGDGLPDLALNVLHIQHYAIQLRGMRPWHRCCPTSEVGTLERRLSSFIR
jgi:hypothetical protein